MDEILFEFDDEQWDAGFTSDRQVVASRLPWPRVFLRPAGFRPRPWHTVYELAIRDWPIVLDPLRLGHIAVIRGQLDIRRQPTFNYAREHLEFLPNLDAHIENSLTNLLKDIAQEEIRTMIDDTAWLAEGCGTIEKAIARLVNEVLVMRGIQCRTQCHIEAQFAAEETVNLDSLPPSSRHEAIYREYLNRRREMQERLARQQMEAVAKEKRLLMERETLLLELEQQEEILRHTRRQQELESLQAELAATEARLERQRESEQRCQQGQLQHQTDLKAMQEALAEHESAAEILAAKQKLEQLAQQQNECQASETRRLEEQINHQSRLRQMQKAAEAVAEQSESERLREKHAAEVLHLEQQLRHEAELRESRLRHEEEQRLRLAEAEIQARTLELEMLRARLAGEETRLKEELSSTTRRNEEELQHDTWLRQMRIEAELRTKLAAAESQTSAEATLQAQQREIEARQREEQLRHETQLRQVQAAADLQIQELELQQLRAEMAKVEMQLKQQREFETRQKHEQLRHEAQLRELKDELELKERERRLPHIAILENHLDQEIGLLAMERQRLNLEEEIREARLSKTQGLISNMKQHLIFREENLATEVLESAADGD